MSAPSPSPPAPSPSKFHPSMFETPEGDIPYNQRVLFLESDSNKEELIGTPGAYKFTIGDKNISKNNTKQVFKNQYSDTLLTQMFFSQTNVENIQQLLRLFIYKKTNIVIDKQSYNEILTIMRSIFLEYSSHPPLIEADMPDAQKRSILPLYTKEVSRLNELVVNDVVPRIQSQLIQYINYIRDISELPKPIERSNNMSNSGQKQYRSVTQVLTGGQL
jgi:hypothetical protein